MAKRKSDFDVQYKKQLHKTRDDKLRNKVCIVLLTVQNRLPFFSV